MEAPSGNTVPRLDVDGGDREQASDGPEKRTWVLVAGLLGSTQRGTVAQVTYELKRAIACGGHPFEVVVGSPHHRYGSRISFDIPVDRGHDFVTSLLQRPPEWGVPDWAGLRVATDGLVAWKTYHRYERVATLITLPCSIPNTLAPVMASRHGEASEIYCRLRPAMDWQAFVADMCARFDVDGMPACQLIPRRRSDAFGLSLKIAAGAITAVSFFADDRTLPDDREIPTAWTRDMDGDDVAAYTAALAAVRTTGARPARGWHAALAWTFERHAGWSRAVSLRVRRIPT